MSALRLPPLSLYIHIPWCVRKCPYCDFNSHEAGESIPEGNYVAQLLADLAADKHLVQGRELTSIFFGGGTPSLFGEDSIAAIIEGARRYVPFAQDIEITLEANPGTAEAARFRGFRDAGVNRMSIGVQSFDDGRLQALGRIHNGEEAIAAIELAGSLDLGSFNVDLMHGLPNQTAQGASEDLLTACDLGVPHVSWYQLTIEPNTGFFVKTPTLPDELVLTNIQQQGEQILASRAYEQYEVSAWSQPGHPARHNLNYWQFGDYLGIGAGAHSKITDLATHHVMRFAKRRQPEKYLQSAPESLRVQERTLDTTDLIGEFMMNALRLREGFTRDDFIAHTGLAWGEVSVKISSLLERMLLEDDGRLRPTALGRRYLDTVIADFF